jgi:hypothetical protein
MIRKENETDSPCDGCQPDSQGAAGAGSVGRLQTERSADARSARIVLLAASGLSSRAVTLGLLRSGYRVEVAAPLRPSPNGGTK